MSRRLLQNFAGALATVALFTSIAIAQTGAKNGEWRTYGADLGNTKYSPLSQIDASNFNKLQLAWRFHTENLGPRRTASFTRQPDRAAPLLRSMPLPANFSGFIERTKARAARRLPVSFPAAAFLTGLMAKRNVFSTSRPVIV